MKRYRISVQGKTYEVEVEELENDEPGPPVSRGVAPKPEPKPTGSEHKAKTPPQATAPADTPAEAPSPGQVTAPMAGKVVTLNVKQGDQINQGDVLLILEAMKMENEIRAQGDGRVKEVVVSEGDSVNNGDLLLKIEHTA